MRFDSYHPAIIALYFTFVVTMTALFHHPVFLGISLVSAAVFSMKLNGLRGLLFTLVLVPFVALFTGFYAYYNHFGVTTVGKTVIGNSLTLESMLYGLALGSSGMGVILWFTCIHRVVTADKVVYLLGRASPRLSLLLAVLLRMVPRLRVRWRKMDAAQTALGRGTAQGPFFRRLRSYLRLWSMLITWTLENLVEISDSMRSRGYALPRRTAYAIYRFDNRDRSVVIALFFSITTTLAGFALDQAKILFDPQIVINPATPLSMIFYTAYAFFCFIPVLIQTLGEWKYSWLRKIRVQEVH